MPGLRPQHQDPSISIGVRLNDNINIDVTVQKVSYGGFGVVAFGPDQRNDGRMVALKSLQASLLNRPSIYDRFVDEGLLWIGLWSHPNIVRVIGVTMMDDAQHAQRPFIVLEYAEQGSLRDWLVRGQLTLKVALFW